MKRSPSSLRQGSPHKGPHEILHPTLTGLVVFLCAALLVTVGAGLGFPVLVAAGLVLMAGFVLEALESLLARIIIVVKRRTRRHSESDKPTAASVPPLERDVHSGLLRFLLPSRLDFSRSWEQVDQSGTVIRTLRGKLPESRGVFRNHGTFMRWKGPWSLWRDTVRLWDSETVLHVAGSPSEDGFSPQSSDSRRPRTSGRYEDDMALSVRPYIPGDPQRQISWKTTARRGQMMTRVADHHRQPQLLVIVDTTVGVRESTDFEGLIAAITRLTIPNVPAESPAVYTDGYVIAEAAHDIEYFLAAVQPDPRGSAEERAQRVDELLAESNIHGLFVTLDSESRSPFEACLEELGALRHAEILRVDPHEDEIPTEFADKRVEDAVATEDPAVPAPSGQWGIRSRIAHCAKRHRGLWEKRLITPSRFNTVVGRILRTLAVEALLIGALVELSSLFNSTSWLAYAVTATALVSAEATLFVTHGRKSVARAGICDALILIAGVVTASVVFHSSSGLWWFLPQQEGAPSSWDLLSRTAAAGTNALLYQSFPVTASVSVDVAMIVCVTIGLIAMRTLFILPRLQVLCAAAPFAVMVAQNIFFNSQQSDVLIGAFLFASLLLLWSCQKSPLLWPTPTILSAAATVLALVLAPATSAAVSTLDLPFVSQRGLFSSTSVNPLIDLSRNLRGNSSSIALNYMSSDSSPLYLRMATLDSFDGDTWTFGSDASPNATAEEKESTAAPGGYSLQRSFTDNSPLMQYAAQTSSRRDEPSGVQSYSKIQIETLTSRFMPLVGLPGTVNPTTSEWEWSKDGTAYSNSTQVKQADSYEIASTYVEPVDSHSGLTETLERLERLIDPPTQDSTRDSSLGLGEYNRYYANGGRADTPRTSFTLDSDAASASNKYVRSHYLSLPKKLPAAISAVVRSAHADAIPNSGATQSQQRDILGYLLDFFDTGKFTYSLDAPDGNSGGNMEMIASFLKRRSGYCVHYATTLAVLARALGVPSRVVMGYLPSSSTSGGNFVVTNQQLHAWTEAYMTGIGWIPLDVTPAGAATNQSSASTDSSDDTEDDTKSSNSSKSDSSSTDSSDTSDQKETSQSAADSTSATGAASWSVLDLVGRIGAGTVIAVAVAALLATPALLRRRRRRVRLGVIRADSSGTVGSRVAWGRAWDEMIDTALDNGVTIPEYASEQKIASIISDALAPAAPAAHEAQKALHQAARAVESLRYSGDAESTEDDGSGHSVADAVLAVRATFVESQRLSEDDASLPSHRLKRAVRSCVNLLRRVKRSLLPASVFSRRRHRPHRPRHPRR